jgi:hypothetical protein
MLTQLSEGGGILGGGDGWAVGVVAKQWPLGCSKMPPPILFTLTLAHRVEALNFFDADAEDDELWERKHGSGPAGTSQADVLQESSQGRRRLQDLREAFKRAQQRKTQVTLEGCDAGTTLRLFTRGLSCDCLRRD